MYIVHFSQDEALKNARALASYGVSDKAQREEIKRRLKNTSSPPLAKFCSGCWPPAWACTGGMLPRYRLFVERPRTQQGLLPVICSTDTLGVGVQRAHPHRGAPAHQVRRHQDAPAP